MRTARKKMIGKGCYYHCMSRYAGGIDELPFSDVDKTYGLRLLTELSEFYLIEPISVCFMGNHIHIVLYAPGEIPDLETAAKRHNDFYGQQKIALNPTFNAAQCEIVATQMIDISRFMSVFKQRFTCYYNRAHRRRGTLWADRFKSTILEGSRESLWNCVKYVELNPVRAGIVENPADYRFCTWGIYSGGGKHLFHDNFCRHMRAVAAWHAGDEVIDDAIVFAEFSGELARIRAWEKDQDRKLDEDGQTKAAKAADKARTKGDSMPVRFLRRTRYWTDGAIIGAKAFVQEIGCQFEDAESHAKILKKRLSRGITPEGAYLHCFKQLRTNLD